MPVILVTLESLLRRHDWWFEYSDDHSVWRKGRDHKECIWSAMTQAHKLGWSVEASQMYRRFCPW